MTSTRRGFFGLLGAAVVPLAAAAATAPPKPYRAPDDFEWNGFHIKWTGWKPSQTSIRLSGQWIAMDTRKRKLFYDPYTLHRGATDFYFINAGGLGGPFGPGDEFNCTIPEWQDYVDHTTDEKKKDHLRAEALKELLSKLKELS